MAAIIFSMMPILGGLILIAGFYLLYYTSRRASLRNSWVRNRLMANRKLCRIVAAGFLLISFFIFANYYGPAVGLFIYLAVLMSVACLLIILYPLHLFKKS